jgi:CysZ protein
MRLIKELVIGWVAYIKALRFINRHRLWSYVLIPAVINLLLFLGLGVFLWQFAAILSEWLLSITGASTYEGTAGNILQWFIRIVVSILTFFLYLKLYRYAILLFSAPALALTAEKTQEILTGISHPFDTRQLLKDIIRGLGITCFNLVVELAFTIPLYILAFIPLLTPVVTLLIIAIESYFVGFSMIDYRNEFRRITAGDSRRLINRHKGLAIGNGLIFNLLLAIPFIGVLVAPTLSVVAAGLAAEQVVDNTIRN